MDVDHLYDYYQVYVKGRHDRVYLLLHAWEYSLVGLATLALYYHPFLLAVALGHLAHVITDHLVNGLSPLGYSITYRACKGFDSAYITPHSHVVNSYQALRKLFPFGRLIEPWFQRRIEPWFQERIKRMSEFEATSSRHKD